MVLGNAGLNGKPIYNFYSKDLTGIVNHIDEISRYRNSKGIVDRINQYAKDHIDSIILHYFADIRYSLYKAGFLTDKENHIKWYLQAYHKILDTELPFYSDKLDKSKKMDFEDEKLREYINKALDADADTQKKAIEHFTRVAQDYLVEQGILQPKQPDTAAIAEKVNDATGIKHTEPAQTSTNEHENVDNSATIHEVLATNAEGSVADAVDTSITDTLIDSADIKNDLYNKLSKYMSMLKLTQYKIPIALLSTVLGIGTIGGAYYATGSTDALDTIGSDTDTEVLNDTNDTAQRHGVCIATITACTVLLALCTTTAYWIVCRQVVDSAYTAMDMMQQINI